MNEKEVELEKLKLQVDVWKKVVDVQQHFNDLEMKVRNFGLLIISAFISAIGVSLKSHYEVPLFGVDFPVGSIIALVALFVWNLVFFVDVYWYHPLLKGAVVKGIELEKYIEPHLPKMGLTSAIGEASSIKFLFWKELRSTTKAKIFYHGVSSALLVISISLFFGTSDKKQQSKDNSSAKISVQKSNSLEAYAERTANLEKLLIEVLKQCSNENELYCEKFSSDINAKFSELNKHMDRHLTIITGASKD